MFTPVRLQIEGFRGFRERQEFAFDHPVIQLIGDNRSGKSSALNALEWCLFGDGCTGGNTGIRERISRCDAEQKGAQKACRQKRKREPDGQAGYRHAQTLSQHQPEDVRALRSRAMRMPISCVRCRVA